MSCSAQFTSFFATTRRISLGLGILKFVRALLTVYSVILSAKYFGATLERDTWVLAGGAVTVLTQIIFGPVHEIFRAKFIHIRAEDGEEMALASANCLIYTIIVISLFFVTMIELFPGVLCSIFAPGFRGTERETLSLMMRLMMPSLLLNEITLIWIAVLNAYNSYFIPDIYSIASVVLNVACILILVPFIGIYSLIVSNYISAVVLVLILIFALQKLGNNFITWRRPRWSLIKPFLMTSFPFYFAYLAGNAQMTIERMLSTYLGIGNVSVLDYARKFIDMPISVIVGVLTTIFTPTIAELFVHKKHDEFHRETIKFMRMLLLGLIPFVVLVSVCSTELVELLLVRGSFNRELIGVTAKSLTLFSLGIVGYIVYAVGAQSLIAQKKASLYAAVGFIATTASIIVNLSLFKAEGLIIFPFSWGLSLFLAGLYMFLYRRHNRVALIKEISKMLGMLLLIMAFSYGTRVLSLHILYKSASNLKIHDFLVVLITALISCFIYVLAMYLFNIEEIQGIKRYIPWKKHDILRAD